MSTLTPEQQEGFDFAIQKILQLCDERIEAYREHEKEMQKKHRESVPSRHKAIALIDLQMKIRHAFKTDV